LAAVLALLVPLVVLAAEGRPVLVRRVKEMLAVQRLVVDMVVVAEVALVVWALHLLRRWLPVALAAQELFQVFQAHPFNMRVAVAALDILCLMARQVAVMAGFLITPVLGLLLLV
jgi:hypothetical protein